MRKKPRRLRTRPSVPRWRPGVEQLESRTLMAVDGIPWSAPSLTISFAPDGTMVGGEASRLSSQFDQLAETAAWQQTILRAFATWAEHTAASITPVNDEGQPLGTPGPTQGDTRFGDVRVAAIPLSPDVLAISIPHDEVISGTWAGDVLFNSQADLASLDEVFAIAVHEAGHVLGLGHSSDPASPMFWHGLTPVVTPTPEDIRLLQQLYGQPPSGSETGSAGAIEEDELPPGEQDLIPSDEPSGAATGDSEYDREHRDDVFTAAQSLDLSPRFQGAIRYEATGKILDPTDIDYFRLTPVTDDLEDRHVLTVTVRSTIPGGMIPGAKVLDGEGRSLEGRVLANADGQLVLQFPDADPRQVHHVAVWAEQASSATTPADYSLHAAFGLERTTLDRLTAGTLQPDRPRETEVLHVRETRLVHLLLTVDPTETVPAEWVWVVVSDSAGQPIYRVAAQAGQSRSSQSVLLQPGDYRIAIELGGESDRAQEVSYRLLLRTLSLPIGPEVVDPTATPIYPCGSPAADTIYCYPYDVAVVDPFVLPDPTPVPLPDPIWIWNPPWIDPYLWYWGSLGSPAKGGTTPSGGGTQENPLNTTPVPDPGSGATNPGTPATGVSWQNGLQPRDVNNDGMVTPLDALVVINFLNRNGSLPVGADRPAETPFYDVNNDGYVGPADVLAVFNDLNRVAAGEAGGTKRKAVGGWRR